MKSSTTRGVSLLAACMMLVGFIARVVPFTNRDGRLLREFPTEDGYLMLTIARNLAIGHGMSTAGGTIPTNGTQPLATFLWAACSFVVGGDKTATVAVVLVVQVIVATLTAAVIYKLACSVLRDTEAPTEGAMLAAAGWYAGSKVVSHTMNCLESGLYVLILALVLVFAFRSTVVAAGPRIGQWAGLGALLGVAFWARNDAVLFCASLALVHLVWGLPGAPSRPIHRFAELAVAGTVVAVVASPWLVFNYTHFGHVMPISGQAESMDAPFALNVNLIGPNLIAYMTTLPIPTPLTMVGWVAALSLVAIGVYVWGTWSLVRRSESDVARKAWLLGATTTAAFAAFYGLFFGAPHFVSRYLFALSPFYAVAWGALVRAAAIRLVRAPVVAGAGAFALVGVCVGLNLRLYQMGSRHPHFQCVAWVNANVPNDVWVGAPQSGTLGYFHDRTLNLDGKVNPLALEALKERRRGEYIVESNAEYLVDWESLAWPLPAKFLTIGDPVVARAFEVVVDDPSLNLAVLRRRDTPAGLVVPPVNASAMSSNDAE